MHGNLEPEENIFYSCTPEECRTTVTGDSIKPLTWKQKLEEIADQIGGTVQYYGTLNSTGKSSKKIVIEYDIEQNSGGS